MMPAPTHHELPPLGRAAAILAALGPGAADQVSAALKPHERRLLEAAARTMARISPDERQRMLRGFARSCRRAAAERPADAGGSARSEGSVPRQQATQSAPPQPCPPPFAYLEQADRRLVAATLTRERPEVIALVAAHAPLAAARTLMEVLPGWLRPRVADALSCLCKPAPGVLEALESALEQELQALARDPRYRQQVVSQSQQARPTVGAEAVRAAMEALRTPEPAASAATDRSARLEAARKRRQQRRLAQRRPNLVPVPDW